MLLPDAEGLDESRRKGFEGGLLVMLVPLMAWWLHVTLLEAFVADLGIFVFFLVYTFAFTWAFDRVFGLPKKTGACAPV